jgi:hypothetical protein
VSSPDARVISSNEATEVEDPVLDRWDRSMTQAGAVFRDVPEPEADDPFDLEVAKPYAVSVHRLYRTLGKKIPTEVRAALGTGRVPLLINHSLTPFYKPGQSPTGVWGMGYRCESVGAAADTIAVAPGSRKYRVADLSQRLSLGIKAGGEISLNQLRIPVSADAASIQLGDASVRATTDQEFAIAIEIAIAVLEIQAAPVGAGGARWNLYRTRESIDVNQPLLQTIMVRRGTPAIRMDVETWVRRNGRFFGLGGARHWTYPRQSFEIDVAELTL